MEVDDAPTEPNFMLEPPSVLTVDEVAGLLRVNRKTVYELIARGEIPRPLPPEFLQAGVNETDPERRILKMLGARRRPDGNRAVRKQQPLEFRAELGRPRRDLNPKTGQNTNQWRRAALRWFLW
jgi:hypothetical protein